jgi:hypothetical protein
MGAGVGADEKSVSSRAGVFGCFHLATLSDHTVHFCCLLGLFASPGWVLAFNIFVFRVLGFSIKRFITQHLAPTTACWQAIFSSCNGPFQQHQVCHGT